MVRVTDFLVALILIGFIITGIALFMSHLATKYTPPASYDNESLETYNQLSALNDLSEEIDNRSSISGSTGIYDYSLSAYNALKISKKSFDTFDTMKTATINQSGVPAAGLLNTMTTAILIILIVIGVFLSALMKWYL